jgi:hypothetical protein
MVHSQKKKMKFPIEVIYVAEESTGKRGWDEDEEEPYDITTDKVLMKTMDLGDFDKFNEDMQVMYGEDARTFKVLAIRDKKTKERL